MPDALSLSRARGAAHVNAGAVAAGDLRIDPAQHQHTAVEGDDLAVLRVARRAARADIVLAARPALELELLLLRLIGEMHQHAAGRPGTDHVRLPALAAGGGFGPGPIGFLMIGGVAPADDEIARGN